MMTKEDRQEALSLAYVHAVAAMCGLTHSVPSKDYGIDLTLNDIREEPHHFMDSGLSLDLQVKSTIAVAETPTTINYDLKVKGYDCLRFLAPRRRILVLSVLPSDEPQWVHQTPTRLEMRQAAYWISLRVRPAVRNRASLRIAILKRQRFTVATLREIMERIRRGEDLT